MITTGSLERPCREDISIVTEAIVKYGFESTHPLDSIVRTPGTVVIMEKHGCTLDEYLAECENRDVTNMHWMMHLINSVYKRK